MRLNDLPEELQLYIFSFLDIQSLLMIAQVSKTSKRISETSTLWKPFEAASREAYIKKLGYDPEREKRLQQINSSQDYAATLFCQRKNQPGKHIKIYLLGNEKAFSTALYNSGREHHPGPTMFGVNIEKWLNVNGYALRLTNAATPAKLRPNVQASMGRLADIAIIFASTQNEYCRFLSMIEQCSRSDLFYLFAVKKEESAKNLHLHPLYTVPVEEGDSLEAFCKRVMNTVEEIAAQETKLLNSNSFCRII
ncbi:F-box-like domain-containing protein [Aquicella lusitana]|uniref:F-box associated protein n=1 Tax=Aquicella lusitana TaxID=254246 RepID=A0A370GZ34_9COXI|nr:F-box-like domain-containing protein [Aquicella lusitana]RDI48770.1 F-box associated protein [Aquicella lusitana]VVC73198.1 hypothetical protein AQULUS_09300 [Aquicella lusitana]